MQQLEGAGTTNRPGEGRAARRSARPGRRLGRAALLGLIAAGGWAVGCAAGADTEPSGHGGSGSGGAAGADGGGGTSADSGTGGRGADAGLAGFSGSNAILEGRAVFVASTGDDTDTGSSPARAVRSVQRGIELAAECDGNPCSVMVAEGSYVESVTLSSGVHLHGGWDAGFTASDPVAHPTVLVGADDRAVTADGLTRPTRLEGLTLRGIDHTGATDGATSTAVWVNASGAHLALLRVRVLAGEGARGVDGAPGGALTCDARGGTGGTAYDCGASIGTDGEADGDPVSLGTGSAGGNSNCPDACPLVGADGVTNGTSGLDGGDGDHGAGGLAASGRRGSFADGAWRGTPGERGQRGRHGTGGGGGGSGGSKRFRACFGCGTLVGGRGGDGAPGGCAGDGGEPGGAGGGAFGLVVIGSTVTVEDSSLVGGRGGRGGNGGDGAPGALGSGEVGNGHEDARTQRCGLIDYWAGAGGLGGRGGNGGHGGGAAGGVGGVAVTVALVDGGTLSRVGTVTIGAGSGGVGGPGGEGPGSPGQGGGQGEGLGEFSF